MTTSTQHYLEAGREGREMHREAGLKTERRKRKDDIIGFKREIDL